MLILFCHFDITCAIGSTKCLLLVFKVIYRPCLYASTPRITAINSSFDLVVCTSIDSLVI